MTITHHPRVEQQFQQNPEKTLSGLSGCPALVIPMDLSFFDKLNLLSGTFSGAIFSHLDSSPFQEEKNEPDPRVICLRRPH